MASTIAPQQTAAAGPARQYKPDALMYAVAAMMWLYVWRIQDIIPGLNKIKPGLLVLIPVVYLFVQARHPLRRLERLKSPLATTALFFLGAVAASVPFALWPRKAFSVITADMVPNYILAGVMAASVRDIRDLLWYLRANLLGAFVFALYVFTNFQIDATGRLSKLLYYDANDFALLMVCSIPCAVLLFRLGRQKWERGFALVALVALIMGIVKSGSRGGFLAFIAVMAYLLIRFDAIPVRQRVMSVALGVIALFALAGEQYWALMRTLANPKADYNWSGQEAGGRMEIWKRGVGYMVRRPITGVGARNFPQAEGTMAREAELWTAKGRGWKWSVAHNSFVEVGAELGVPGLIIFIALFYQAFKLVRRLKPRLRGQNRAPPTTVAIAQAIAAALLGFIVAGFFVSAEYFSFLYVFLGLAAALYKLVRYASPQVPAGAPTGVRRGFPRRIAVAR